MQWSDEPNAGFTTGTPWLIVNPNYIRINMKSQLDNPNSIRNFYKRMIGIRSQSEILKFGSFEAIETREYLFAYKRTYNEQSLVIALNFSPVEQKFKYSGEVLLSNYATEVFNGVLKPYEAVIIKA